MTRAPGETDFLAALQELTRRFPEAVARAAIDQAILRRQLKFIAAEHMSFTRDALQQSTQDLSQT